MTPSFNPAEIEGISKQPVAHVQWVHRDKLTSNDYNPNHVAGPELDLLRQSLIQDGWTLPLVVQEDYTLVDGFHRHKLSGEPDIYARTNGFVPVVILPQASKRSHAIASTVRYNRARGIHAVLKMSDIVYELIEEQKMPASQVAQDLGMEEEEIDRLLFRGKMTKYGAADEYQQAWVPTRGDTNDYRPRNFIEKKQKEQVDE